MLHAGTIVKLTQGREITATLQDADGNEYKFSFFCFNGYRGQGLRELTEYGTLGIQKGTKVCFKKDSNQVKKVFPKREQVQQGQSPHSP